MWRELAAFYTAVGKTSSRAAERVGVCLLFDSVQFGRASTSDPCSSRVVAVATKTWKICLMCFFFCFLRSSRIPCTDGY